MITLHLTGGTIEVWPPQTLSATDIVRGDLKINNRIVATVVPPFTGNVYLWEPFPDESDAIWVEWVVADRVVIRERPVTG